MVLNHSPWELILSRSFLILNTFYIFPFNPFRKYTDVYDMFYVIKFFKFFPLLY